MVKNAKRTLPPVCGKKVLAPDKFIDSLSRYGLDRYRHAFYAIAPVPPIVRISSGGNEFYVKTRLSGFP